MEILLHLATAAAYGGLAAYFWRALESGPLATARALSLGERLALLAPIAVHGVLLWQAIHPASGLHFGFAVALSLMVWLAVVLFWLESLWVRLGSLHLLALPAAAAVVCLPLVFPPAHLVRAEGLLFRAHFLSAMLAYSLSTLAALHAVLMALVEKRLHTARFSRMLSGLPPLLTMEAVLFRVIGMAFVLLTFTVGSGVLFSEAVFGRALRFDHKTVFAIASWLIFGALVFGRLRWGWRGRVALRWTLAGFSTLLLAYVGTRFVLEVVLGRA